jgi:hypothetical protein
LISLRLLVLVCCSLVSSGCVGKAPTPRTELDAPHAGPRLPKAGERSVELRSFYGIPILQKSLFWDGNGEDDQAGVRARHYWHVSDRFAIGAGLGTSVWFLNGPDALALEGEAIGRYYFYRGDSMGLFGEVTGGWMQSTKPVPEGGTEWNMTFSFSPGLEFPVSERVIFLSGFTYHHVSNALGRQNSRNPSQNEAQLWLGFGLRL